MNADEIAGYLALVVAVAWLTAALTFYALGSAAAKKRPPMPRPRPAADDWPVSRIVVSQHCPCPSCTEATRAGVNLITAMSIARAEVATVEREWAEWNGADA